MRDQLRRLPKAELHVHLDGSLRPDTMLALARDAGVTLPASDPAALARWMLVTDARNLEDYLARFEYTIALLQHAEALERVAYEMVEDAAADGVRYLEVRYCPALSTGKGLSIDGTIAAEWQGLQRGSARFGVTARLICCALRHRDPEEAVAIAEASVRMRAHGVVGFDLAGPEAGHPPSVHGEAFEVAHRGGLGITIHAGEAAGWESIADAVHNRHAVRIGHGTRLGENQALLEFARDHGICLEVNITSNLQTRVVERAEDHPVRSYFDAGVPLTLGTDNWLMSGVSLSGEYLLAHEALGFTASELTTIALAGFQHAFLPDAEREALVRDIETSIRSSLGGLEEGA